MLTPLTLYKKAEAKTASTNFIYIYLLTALYFHISIWIFCTLLICFVFDGLLQSIYFRMFSSKHSITFDYLLSCWSHCCDIFYIKFRFCESYTVTNSVTIILLMETLSNFTTIKCYTLFFISTNSRAYADWKSPKN